jgi:hypothetical protein
MGPTSASGGAVQAMNFGVDGYHALQIRELLTAKVLAFPAGDCAVLLADVLECRKLPAQIIFRPAVFVVALGEQQEGAVGAKLDAGRLDRQAGVVYRVLYRNDLGTGNWTLLTTVLGDGTVKGVSDTSGDTARFYKVVAP